ncbi:acetate--CoA ligase family protein [Tateyamaria pelophila]|uniref:acetate--CoA ligase family protein n=1 Tax=Tateyamaria pelophila TaxID=328415 RepID=UPI001CC03622|nr:acetate--CoA ligase family protein [Tateyamaria pelophila]
MKIEIQKINGYAYGAIQSSLVMRFSNASSESDTISKTLKKLQESLPVFQDGNRFSTDGLVVNLNAASALYVTVIDILNHHCGDQRFTPIKVFEDGDSLCFALPTLSPAMSVFNINAVQLLLSKLRKGLKYENIIEFEEDLKKQARGFLSAGTNAGNFIAAAAERKIPFKVFNQRYIIFGYGSGSSIFSGSITDQESSIGVSLAKSKLDTNRLLKMSGFPVAQQARVRAAEDAVRFAERVGYPVVLKPESEEQGRGVFANIIDEDELKECFSELSESSYGSILIEQHVPGDVYRINTIDGEVVRVVKRVAAQLLGDGQSTVKELLDGFNNEPLRLNPNSSMMALKIDDDVVRTLTKQSVGMSSVPKKGESIYLTSISSVSRGGHSLDFISEFHPDNRVLCEKISNIMRLNITGIDILAIDASQSWRDGNFWICEVNSQPQLGVSHMQIYGDVLGRKIKNRPNVSLFISIDNADVTPLFDTRCNNITAAVPYASILRDGCPVQYFDSLEISEDIPEDIRRKLESMLVSVEPDLNFVPRTGQFSY